ncbi:MAG TPA: hypothetical protein VM537_11315 [Anaerolineae bacterium]|nr:hypothetical protein [Anaerolineae bacterium]
MSHLDTAYQIGMKQAEVDFEAELQKAALQASAPPPLNTTGQGIVPTPQRMDVKPMAGQASAGALPGRTPGAPPPPPPQPMRR